ncbi:hypothetical protein [Shewanella youngdeokensis]|uniref:Uncharacterized protein n=1 Tax=Shewanella youngdeokensis TaxID=2999068 RepID=A0ABZ0K1C4_9GAMM|nr:hypothetical protein RGE70_06020 [Shewanella sp. DAU334]
MKNKLYRVLSTLTALSIITFSGVVAAEPNNRLINNDSNDKIGSRIIKNNNKNSNNTVIINQNNRKGDNHNKNNNKHNNNTVIVNPGNKHNNKHNNNTVIVAPGNKHNNKHNNVVIVKPTPKPIVVQPIRGPWYRPIVPGWRNWHGGKVVIVDNHHHHYPAFAVAMTAMAIAIVVDQSSGKPYTDSGKPVTIKERTCHQGDETEVIDLDNELLIITCK